MRSSLRFYFFISSLFLATLGVSTAAQAVGGGGDYDISTGLSFNRVQYAANSYSWTRRWGGSVGINFSASSGIELSLQDLTERTYIPGYEDTTFHDQVMSVNWVQQLIGRGHALQPYVKVGVGQLNREGSGTYANGTGPGASGSLTAVTGLGMRVYLTRSFAIRTEATSYLTGGNIQTWRDNVGVTFGTSLSF